MNDTSFKQRWPICWSFAHKSSQEEIKRHSQESKNWHFRQSFGDGQHMNHYCCYNSMLERWSKTDFFYFWQQSASEIIYNTQNRVFLKMEHSFLHGRRWKSWQVHRLRELDLRSHRQTGLPSHLYHSTCSPNSIWHF